MSYKEVNGVREHGAKLAAKETETAADEGEALQATGHETGPGCRRRCSTLFHVCAAAVWLCISMENTSAS